MRLQQGRCLESKNHLISILNKIIIKVCIKTKNEKISEKILIITFINIFMDISLSTRNTDRKILRMSKLILITKHFYQLQRHAPTLCRQTLEQAQNHSCGHQVHYHCSKNERRHLKFQKGLTEIILKHTQIKSANQLRGRRKKCFF